MVKEHARYDFNMYKFIKTCFMVQYMAYFSDYSIVT